MGVCVGVVAWAPLFLPITTIAVILALDRILIPLAANSELYSVPSQVMGMIPLVIAGFYSFSCASRLGTWYDNGRTNSLPEQVV